MEFLFYTLIAITAFTSFLMVSVIGIAFQEMLYEKQKIDWGEIVFAIIICMPIISTIYVCYLLIPDD